MPSSPNLLPFREPAPPGPPPTALSVLLVDDDELVRHALAGYLKRLGCRARCVASGPEALEAVASGLRPDLAVLDVAMPGMDGVETLVRLRALHPDLPALFITGFMEERARGALAHQPNVRLLRKPFSLEALAAALDAYR